MGRQRTPSSKLHRHCETCYSRRCRVPVEISVSCLLINCRNLCGAAFHMCKEDEHMLLCPNEQVPCLNHLYGCPFTMCRSRLAPHIEVCPASVVFCSMDWNRWPAENTNGIFYENILKATKSEDALDLSMALRDQKKLFQSLQMKAVFPELIKKVAEVPVCEELEGAVGGATLLPEASTFEDAKNETLEEGELTQEEREALARSSIVDLENYNIWEKMFSMELSGCNQTIKAFGSTSNPSNKKEHEEQKQSLEPLKEEPQESEKATPIKMLESNLCQMEDDKFVVASSIYAASSKSKFIYGRIAPMKIISVRTFKIPTSFIARPGHIRNPIQKKRFNMAVDTSDLGVSVEELPKWDEVKATLLCSLEKELRGHLIAESSHTDYLFEDTGTQTYDFFSAPFDEQASLADVVADQALNLHVQIETESVTRKHNKSSSAFTFLCCHSFRRDEYASHYKNVHSDIQFSVSGWFEQRCPLAYLGCPFFQRRFQPSTQRATVSYNQELSAFVLRPEVAETLCEGMKSSQRKQACNVDTLNRLPFELLQHIAGFLDSFTLSQLALVSRQMRDVCSTLLPEKGMVSLKWEKKTYSHGGSSWKSRKKVWQFSNHFSTVDRWIFDNIPPISQHLKVCSYYQRDMKTNRVPLHGIFERRKVKDGTQSLVSMFRSEK
ncbi:F-box protein 40.1 [Denticeps clupeoides]|uniref:Uncharacterized protein n=1 Tax=Denticeps clupeoides TaxID=299321 RepID=A0AAY4BM87_9TELE|nr:F-box only protein 40-like [Denticeps clupeoides]XP_028839926.1 F-box only protein 40-like [Denticeps clupeoides]